MSTVRSMGRIVNTLYNAIGQIRREQVDLACSYLNEGKVIAVPTDTIYGLAVKVSDSDAIQRIYNIKDRSSSKPLSVCLADIEEVDDIADTTTRVSRILTSFFPGPVTLLLKRDIKLNPDLNPGLDTVGIRIPDNNFIRAIVREIGPLALTSANKSGEKDPVLVEDFAELHSEVDCIFDIGLLRVPKNPAGDLKEECLGSTVIDLSIPGKYKIIREGCSVRRYINLLNRFGFQRVKMQ